MSDEQIQKLLQGAIKAARNGDKALARKAFLQVLKSDPENESAWLGLATVGQDKKEQLLALKHLLEKDPAHEKANEALRRMGVDPQRLLRSTDSRSAAEEAAPVPEPEAEALPDLPDWLADADNLPALDTPAPETASPPERPIRSLKSLKPSAPSSDSMPDFDRVMRSELDEKAVSASRVLDEASYAEISAESMDEDLPSLEELVKRLTPQYQGTGGVPRLGGESLDAIAAMALEMTQTERADLLEDAALVVWQQKNSRRAGENEMRIYRTQVFVGLATAVVIIGGVLLAFLLSQPGIQRVVFAPTWTPSPTFTLTPTSTPGVTPTPSVTPELTLTPSPTIPPTVTPGRRDIPPDPTNIYVPVGVARERGIVQSADLINRGQLEEAFPILERERLGTANSGNFLPYYYLSLWHLANDNDIESAREILEEGEALWQERGRNVPFDPQINASFARVDLIEAEQLIQANQRAQALPLLSRAEERLVTAINADQAYIEAHVLLAQRFTIDSEFDEALRVLREAQNNNISPDMFTDTNIRLAEARIYQTLGRYDDALQTLYDLLYINPYQDDALRLQIEVALAKGEPGLAVIFSEQYLFYYPGRVEGYKLLADARIAEGKTDLALNEYARGLQGDETAPAYSELLQGRASIYLSQRRYSQAQEDLSEALRLSNNNPAVRAQRMNAAYLSGDYAVAQADAAALSGSNSIPASELALLRARILLDQDGNAEEALESLNNAFSQGLPSISQPVANRYLADAYYRLGRYSEALTSIDNSLAATETASGRYLRGRILEARGRETEANEDLQAALLDYEFVLSWGSVFPYDYDEDALQRYEALQALLASTS